MDRYAHPCRGAISNNGKRALMWRTNGDPCSEICPQRHIRVIVLLFVIGMPVAAVPRSARHGVAPYGSESPDAVRRLISDDLPARQQRSQERALPLPPLIVFPRKQNGSSFCPTEALETMDQSESPIAFLFVPFLALFAANRG